MNGATEITVRQADAGDTLIWADGPLLTVGGNYISEEPCFTMVKEAPGITRLVFNHAPDNKDGKWTMDDLKKTPLCFPDKTEALIIGGHTAIWMCAAVAVAAHSTGIRNIHCDSPLEKPCISVGMAEPGKLVHYEKRVKNGLVIGIVGDPNSGKSVFKGWLEKIIKDEWPNSWWIEADPASPTPNWYLDGLKSPQMEKVTRIRDETKKDWSQELELMVAGNLRNAREKLDITLVDFPGGYHKVSPPQRIPPGREVIFNEVDLFIILYRDEAIREGWLSALREHNLENRVFAEIESQLPDNPPYMETQKKGNTIIGIARGLNRINTGPSIKQLIRPGAEEIIRFIHEKRRSMV